MYCFALLWYMWLLFPSSYCITYLCNSYLFYYIPAHEEVYSAGLMWYNNFKQFQWQIRSEFREFDSDPCLFFPGAFKILVGKKTLCRNSLESPFLHQNPFVKINRPDFSIVFFWISVFSYQVLTQTINEILL